MASAQLLAQASLAIDYFSLRAQDSLKKLLDDTVADEKRSLQITQSRYAYGVAAKADVVTAQTQLLSVRLWRSMPPLHARSTSMPSRS